MSKELEALEIEKHLKDFVLTLEMGKVDEMFINNSFEIIETALKRLEELDSLYTLTKYNGKFYVVIDKTEFNQISKKLKALEIIKKKECLFKGLSELTQEEFDLLKEVF